MSELIDMVSSFWMWSNGRNDYTQTLPCNSFHFPQFEQLCNLCISLINSPLSADEANAFLMSMAIDSETEKILDACKEYANPDFLHMLLTAGVTFPQHETRWQLAELLRKDIPDKNLFLGILLSDPNSYVRKRATNILNQDQ